MAGDFASDLESIAAELRRQADGALFSAMTRAMRDGVEPAIEEIHAGLKPYLPDRYAEVLDADLDLTVSVSTAGREPGVSLIARTRSRSGTGRHATGVRKLQRLDEGLLTHPGPGNDREHWYTQTGTAQGVTPGFFTGPARAAEPRVLRNLEEVLEDVANVIDRKAAAGG
jgi:hypothetical protein